VVTMTTGVSFGFETLTAGRFRIRLQSTAVTAANTNTLFVYPATTSGFAVANLGNVYAGGVQAENALSPGSYLPTTTGTVTRAAESFTFPFLVTPRALTVYVKFLELGTLSTASSTGLIGIGASINPALFLFNDGTGKYAFTHGRGSDAQSGMASAAGSPAPSFGQLCELRGVLNADGSVQLGQAINLGAEVLAPASSANAFASAWNDTTLVINGRGNSSPGFTAIASVRIAAGAQSLGFMRGLS